VREQNVLDPIVAAPDGITIAEIAAAAFPDLSRAQANSWARNQLRELVKRNLIERVGKGRYRAVACGPASGSNEPESGTDTTPVAQAQG
jgi:hypothetical protein